MVAKDYQKTKGSAKAEVGEIDTSAPFQSVKDAVSLFGEGAFSGQKPGVKKTKPQSAERVLAKQTQLHLAEKELTKLKERLKNAENNKTQALLELKKAKQAVEDLNEKLKIINESKESAIRASEVAKNQMKQFSEGNNGNSSGTHGSMDKDLDATKIQYMAVVTQLDVAKQELTKIHQEYDASAEAKERAATEAAEADAAARVNMGQVDELSKEIAAVQDTIQQVNLVTEGNMEEETKIYANKDKQKQLHKARLEESAKELLALKKEVNPELTRNLETQLSKTSIEMDSRSAADLDSVKAVTMELDGAKESLHKMAGEERSLKSMVDVLKLELHNVEKEHSDVKEKEAETELIASNLHLELQKVKIQLQEALAEEAKARGASDNMIAPVPQLVSESRTAKHESQEMKLKAEALKREAEASRIQLEEALKKVKVITNETEEAKAAEIRALDQIKLLSEKTDAARSSTSEPGAQITISRDEFESLSRMVEESENLADLKAMAARAQVEAVKASETEAIRRLEATQKEIEDMKAATIEALKKAEMAEAAKKAVEVELQRRREWEQKRAADTASLILAETEKSFKPSPCIYQIQHQRPQDKTIETRKLEKAVTFMAKKALMPSLTGVFHKKKNNVDGGSPSYLPGERPVW